MAMLWTRRVRRTADRQISEGHRDGVHGRRSAVSFIIRTYRKWEYGFCPTSPASSRVSWRPTVLATVVANGAASSSSGPRVASSPAPTLPTSARAASRTRAWTSSRHWPLGDGLPPALWIEKGLSGADVRGVAGAPEGLAG